MALEGSATSLCAALYLTACSLSSSTGCIFHYDDDFPEGSGKGFKEADKPNFTGSYYSYTKAMLESLLKVCVEGGPVLSAKSVGVLHCVRSDARCRRLC